MEEFLSGIQSLLGKTGMGDSITTSLSALLVLILGWLIAKGISRMVKSALKKTQLDEKLLGNATGDIDTNTFVAKFVYYLVMMFVLMVVLETIGLTQVLDPIKNMLNKFMVFVPNLLAAGIIAFVGYIIATFVSNLISLSGHIVDNIATKAGFSDSDKFVTIIKKVIFILILIPFLIQSLNALNLDAITGPVNLVLSEILLFIPNLLGVAVIMTLFVVGGRFLVSFIEELLKSMGVDSLVKKLKLDSMIGEDQSLSKLIGGLVFFFLIFFGVITSVDMLELTQLSDILNTILDLTGQILFGLLILVLGNFIANLIYSSLIKSESNKHIAGIARVGIVGIFLALSLHTMGIANNIVELAFGLTLGSLAVAFALAYGLGGRDAAGKHFKEIINKFIKNKD